jgi:hypothetical protein
LTHARREVLGLGCLLGCATSQGVNGKQWEKNVLGHWEQCQRFVAYDKLGAARIKTDKAAEKALAKKRKGDK